MAELRPTLGDPLRVMSDGKVVIWRYLAHGGGVFIDVLVKNNVAKSVTVVRRFDGVSYVDAKGAAFGMTTDQVQAKLGVPARISTNADDGSVDLWYSAPPYGWIYEFYSGKLGFIQLIAAPGVVATFSPGPPAAPDDGSSFQNAILIRPSSFLSNATWIDAYLAINVCGDGGHWKETSLKLAPDSAKVDPLAYTIVHASCTVGSSERDLYFDTHGAATTHGNQATIYIDPSQLHAIPASPSPGASPPRR